MAARSSSRQRSVPVSVVVERRPRSVSTPTPQAPSRPTTRPTAMTPTWHDHHRRRMMWIIVGVGTFMIILIWISVFSAQLRGTAPTFFGDVTQLIRNVRWPWEPEPVTPQEQEIRELEQQVFPQFQ